MGKETMQVETFLKIIGSEFYVGVPDSQLKALCDYLMKTYGTDPARHIIAANEGNCAAIAAGYHLATGKIPVVYMQNSGEGNMINPVASLLNEELYAIPVIFIIGWRGEPGIPDEPQHIYQGRITMKLLEDMNIPSFVVSSETTEKELSDAMADFRANLSKGRSAAFVVKKGALFYEGKAAYRNENQMLREEIIRHIIAVSKEDPVISTTGKTSRELFEIRAENKESHKYDFLTVGSMGHASSIALGIALHKPDRKIWCIDGDGAVLMHMGAMAVIGSSCPNNLVHIVINNGAHESVGGMPTAASTVDLVAAAKACGYQETVKVYEYDALDKALKRAKESNVLTFIEAAAAIGARADLGRPTIRPVENKKEFEGHLKDEILLYERKKN